MDDDLITKAGGVKDMEIEEVKMALVERGIDVLGKNDNHLRGDLNAWLKSKEKVPAEKLLLTRYDYQDLIDAEVINIKQTICLARKS